ncbi:MAG: alcohol dehydrogenase [Spirochaetes bacterium]|nr:MAG: alcohol dehydrogenase [Spirochaetota bacterium]
MNIPEKMKAAVLYNFKDIRVEEREVPAPGDDEVLIKIAACGICGTDVKIITHGMPKQPPFGEFIIGHEYAGEVVKTGKTVDEFKVGDRVAVEIHKGCGRCKNCIMGHYTACLNYGNIEKGHRANGFTCNGGFAEYAVNHVNTLYKLPDHISFDESTIITTAGTCIYGIDMTGGYIPGDTVAVLGPGPIGLMSVQVARALGAGKIILTGTREERLELGKKLGADHTINIKEEDLNQRMMELTDGLGADLVLEAAGGENSLQQALESVRKGGKICLLAFYKKPVTADISIAVRNGVNLYTVRGEGRMSVGRALALMAQGRITGKPLITHTFPLEKINEAFKTFMERIGGAMKVVVHP